MWPFSPSYPECRPEQANGQVYDYIIVGGGTAGCVLASRLSEDPNITVLVLEKGPANDTFLSRIPLLSCNIFLPLFGSQLWLSEKMTYCDREPSFVCRGQALGGTSRINGMVYTWGTPADYDAWAQMGHSEWSYEKVLPYFMKSEKLIDQQDVKDRGYLGPWLTRSFVYAEWLFKAYQVFADCAENMGFPRVSDSNSSDAPPDAMTTVHATVSESRQRVSTFDAFLPRKVALQRQKSLTICTNTTVHQIMFSKENEVISTKGVTFGSSNEKFKGKESYFALAKKEVIICSGALGSPQVLMLSGIGPREHLEVHGIEVVHDLPGVGSTLADHHGIPVAWEVPLQESLNILIVSPLKGFIQMLKYLFFRTGLLSMPTMASALFLRSQLLNNDSTGLRSDVEEVKGALETSSDPHDHIPDIELMPISTSGTDNIEERDRVFSKIGVFSILAALAQPKSTGTVRLASANPYATPLVDLGILSDPVDYKVARAAIRLSLKLGNDMKASGFPLLRNVLMANEKLELDDDELDKYIRKRIQSELHFACTCKMGAVGDETPGVVDDELKVHGVVGLRVCDASVFPRIVSHHMQAPIVMVAEKCADMIKADQ